MTEPPNLSALITPYGCTYVRYDDAWYPIPPNGHVGEAWDWAVVSRLGPFTNADPETTVRAVECVRLELAS